MISLALGMPVGIEAADIMLAAAEILAEEYGVFTRYTLRSFSTLSGTRV
jgi:hypothetical protein